MALTVAQIREQKQQAEAQPGGEDVRYGTLVIQPAGIIQERKEPDVDVA